MSGSVILGSRVLRCFDFLRLVRVRVAEAGGGGAEAKPGLCLVLRNLMITHGSRQHTQSRVRSATYYLLTYYLLTNVRNVSTYLLTYVRNGRAAACCVS